MLLKISSLCSEDSCVDWRMKMNCDARLWVSKSEWVMNFRNKLLAVDLNDPKCSEVDALFSALAHILATAEMMLRRKDLLDEAALFRSFKNSEK